MRPHPSDDPNHIRKLMFKHGVKSDLVECIATNEAFPWISAAHSIFHNCCTTSIEGGFCSTPVFTYAPSNISLYQEDEVNRLFPIVKSIEECFSKFHQIQNKNKDSIDFMTKISNWDRFSLDYKNQIASFIADRISQSHIFEKNNIKKPYPSIFDIKKFRNECVSMITSIFGQNDRKILLNKFPRTGLNEISKIINHICKYRGYKKVPNLNAINSTLFGLYS